MKGLCFWLLFLVPSSASSLWDLPVPYTLHRDLDLNVKGVVLRALDQFRLKSCIDFTVRETQDYFIHVQHQDRQCSSSVGQQNLENGQIISFSRHCSSINTVEEHFFRTLGFYPEHVRPDRDDFITIVYENIREGKSEMFNIVNDISTQGFPYDYRSVTHFGSHEFSKVFAPTIRTKDPKYQDVIGQSEEMSPGDAKKLNLRYKCNDSVAFQLYCDFSDGAMCHMTNRSGGSTKWERVTRAEGGPSSDHTSLPSVTAEEGFTPQPPQEGHFMHVSTAAGEAGDSAWLETPRMKPKRQGHLQCLQFYYFHNGSADDQLNIWIREFNNETNTARLMGQVTGPPTSHWRIHHVSLDAQSEFQVEFEVEKGNGSSSGGISIDDINLSEIQCPDVTMQIDDFEHVLTTSPRGTFVFSPRHYSSGGYAYRLAVELDQVFFGLGVQLLSGQNDDELTWPCLNRQVTLQVVDQTPNIQHHMSLQHSFTTSDSSFWDNPRKVGRKIETNDTEEVFGNILDAFIKGLSFLKSLNYLKGGSAVFALNFRDITPLINGSSLPKAKLGPTAVKLTPKNPRHDSCTTREPATAHPATAHPATPHPATAHPATAHPATAQPATAHPATAHPTTDQRPPPTMSDGATVGRSPMIHKTLDDRRPRTHETLDDRSIFCFSPAMMSSPTLILLSAVLLWIA
ncbi:meprin A subunit beta-like [Synchiropus splendidus]|uniref:meprin A subunit beta-like n=1 Tax=Synchiropus splendidus TaxID=270530 RepID=UPI00237D35DF|nr:meprin A subunit beta-like [Synchiropus splendidus]XP_053737365.1 meprin A subunit beta-like [Synchiropus splendidus]